MSRILARVGAWGLLLGVGLFCAACASVLGDDYTIGSCSGEATCSDCIACSLDADCKNQFDACNASFDCQDLRSCIIGCPTDSTLSMCIDACNGSHREGAALEAAVTACSNCGACTALCGTCN